MKYGNVLTLASAAAGCAALASVTAVIDGKGQGGRPEPKAPEYKILAPITYKNLTIFPVTVAGLGDQKSLASRYITLDEGLKTGVVEVREMSDYDDGTPLQRQRPGGGFGGGGGFTAQQPQREQTYQSGAQVNSLALYNRSGKRLMLLAGEMVVGGRQDRIVQKDTLVPPSPKPLPLAVFCVEHGRWVATSTKFGNQIGEQAASAAGSPIQR